MFDKIIIITLEGEKKRQDYCREVMKKLGWDFEFFYAKRHPMGGTWGCYESHMLVIKRCMDEKLGYVLICEDDILPTKYFSQELMQKSFEFMKSNDKWTKLKYGYSICNSQDIYDSYLKMKKVNKNIFKFNSCLTHCYAIQSKTCHQIYNLLKKNYQPSKDKYLHLDRLFYYQLNDVYHLVPMIMDQKWCFETTNKVNNLSEKVLKRFGCLAERNELIPKMNLIIYNEKNYYMNLWLFLIPILIVFLIYWFKN